ncbi:hypothetical protein [Nocardioides convexus]|uniref:hypothetical protein n=1 Tax=Nocardioides convexus TaxID=2712224 RepID=UPI0024188A52|nr:hypothetical protein [Nocardioides convexus]
MLAPLGDLLGVSLTLVGYQGLAVADVRLERTRRLVVRRLAGGAAEQARSAYATLIRATIDALSRESTDNTVAIQALNKILTSTVTASVGAINLSDVLHVAPTDTAAMKIDLDVLDLVASARLADGKHFLGVPNIQGQVPGVGYQYTGGINLISAAGLACGAPNSTQAVADTSQAQRLGRGALHQHAQPQRRRPRHPADPQGQRAAADHRGRGHRAAGRPAGHPLRQRHGGRPVDDERLGRHQPGDVPGCMRT